MSSTSVNITNDSDVAILAKLKWAYSWIGSVDIPTDGSGSIGCEYVWYDLHIFNQATGGSLRVQDSVYGNSSWKFSGTAGNYSLKKD